MTRLAQSAFFWFVITSLASLSVLAASLSREIPSRVDPGADFTVKLSLPDAKAGESLTVEETIPAGVTLRSWDISGVKESKSDIQKDPQKYRVKNNAYGWSVTPTGPVTVSYSAKAPSTQGTLSFDAVWFDKSGFNHNTATVLVSPESAPSAAASAPTSSPAPSPTLQPAQPSAPAPKPSPAKQPAGGPGWAWMVVLLAVLIGAAWWYMSKKK